MTAAVELKPEYVIRIADDRDHSAILATWLNSYRKDDGPQLRCIDYKVFFEEHPTLVKNLIGHVDAKAKRDKAIVLVAADGEDERHVFGWLVAEFLSDELVVHYVFTFAPFRRFGIARALLKRVLEERGDRKLVASHMTHAVRPRCRLVGCKHSNRKKCDLEPGLLERSGFSFNPYRIHP